MVSLASATNSESITPTQKIFFGIVILAAVIFSYFRSGFSDAFFQFPTDNILNLALWGIEGVLGAASHYNLFGIIISAILGWFLFGSYYVDLAIEHGRNITWAFFFGLCFGVFPGILYPLYVWIRSKIVK